MRSNRIPRTGGPTRALASAGRPASGAVFPRKLLPARCRGIPSLEVDREWRVSDEDRSVNTMPESDPVNAARSDDEYPFRIVPKKTDNALSDKQLLDYRNKRRKFVRWLLDVGKDPDHDQYHGKHGNVVAILEDDTDTVTGDDRESVVYRVELETGETADFRWRDLRPPFDEGKTTK